MDEYERGFEQAYKRREAEILDKSREHVAVLGYN
jgi:hypothetical protein